MNRAAVCLLAVMAAAIFPFARAQEGPPASDPRPHAPAAAGAVAAPPPGAAGMGPDASGAPAPASLELGLGGAIERARAASPRLNRLRALESAADAGVRGARAARLPQVDLLAGYTRYSDVPELTIPQPGAPARTIFPNLPDNFRSRLGLSVPLYTGGRLAGLVDAAEQERLAAGKDLDAGGADLVLETTLVYWNLVTARENARVLQEALASYDAHLTDARNRQQFGLAAANETLAVEVERDRAELGRLQSLNDAEVANADLLRLLGLPPGTRVKATEPLALPAPPSQSLEDLVQAAYLARPERSALEARVAAAAAAVRAERAARLPQASLSAGYDYANPNRRILPPEAIWEDTWDVSLNLSFSVFDSGRAAAAVARSAARLEAARQDVEDLDRRIRLEVTARHLDLQTAAAAVQVAGRGLESAAENRRVSQDRYRQGVLPSSDLLDAEVALLRAGLNRTEALTRQRLAIASLERAVGR